MTDATRLRGDGVRITLADGTTEELVFDFDALCELEEMFGTLNTFTHRLAAGAATKIVNTVAQGVTAALRHLEPAPDVAAVRRMLDGRRINDYLDALDEAFVAGMPAKPDVDDAAPKATGETDASPGTTSTTSEPSSSAAATASSGV